MISLRSTPIMCRSELAACKFFHSTMCDSTLTRLDGAVVEVRQMHWLSYLCASAITHDLPCPRRCPSVQRSCVLLSCVGLLKRGIAAQVSFQGLRVSEVGLLVQPGLYFRGAVAGVPGWVRSWLLRWCCCAFFGEMGMGPDCVRVESGCERRTPPWLR